MKYLIVLAITLMTSSVFAKDITLTGLQAKALYSALSIEELSIFHDGGMGKSYITIGPVYCFKNVTTDVELMGCVFGSADPQDTSRITLGSTDNYNEVGEIRFALSEATKAEIATSTRKDLKVKGISCKYSGYGHVLDSIEIEVKYECNISL
jgi:hypothetical protein